MHPTYEQAHARTQQLRIAALQTHSGQDDTALAAHALSVETWVNAYDERRVEILLSCGGPSDGIDIDERDAVTYWTTDTPDRTKQTVRLSDADAGPWLEHYGEVYQ